MEAKGQESAFESREIAARKQYADRNEIPAASHSSGTGIPIRRLERFLAGWLEQTSIALSGDGDEDRV